MPNCLTKFALKMKVFWSFHPALLLAILFMTFLFFYESSQKEGEIKKIWRDGKGRIVFWIDGNKVRPSEDELNVLQEGFEINAFKRFIWKERFQKHLNDRFPKGELGDMLASLLMGTPLPSSLRPLFQQTGLLHLVAISGFHFSLLRGFVFAVLGLLCRGKTRVFILLLFLGSYALFLGGIPSVLRAFFSSAVTLVCLLKHRHSKPLNTFGLSLLFTLMMNPLVMRELSFQMSFGITFSILVLYPYLKEKLVQPSLHEVRKRGRWMQGYLLIRTLFEQSMIFLLSVLLMALPLSLYAFHSFPLLSLFANLLFTPLFSFLVAGTVIATIIPSLDGVVQLGGRGILYLLRLLEGVKVPTLQAECPFYIVLLVAFVLLLLAVHTRKSKENLYEFLM